MGKFDSMRKKISRRPNINLTIANSKDMIPSLLDKPFTKNKRLQRERVVSKLRFRRINNGL